MRAHGVVLESARGAAPSLAQAIAGTPIVGSWWSHPKGRQIFAVTRAVRASPAVLTCRVVDGKVTFVHRRCWPALVAVADRFPAARLSRLQEHHTETGRHLVNEVPFPEWVPVDVLTEATQITEGEALALLGEWALG